MRIRRIEQFNVVGQTHDVSCPAGKYFGLLIRFKGINAELQTATLAAFGNVLVRFRGIPIVTASVPTLWDYTQLRGGFPTFNSAQGDAVEATFVIPFRYGQMNTDNPDDNILNAGANELVLTPSPLSDATFASCTIQVAALLDYGVARYMVQIAEQTPTLVGSDRPRLSVPNLKHIYISEPDDTVPDSVLFTSGSPSMVIFEEEWEMINALTNLDSAVEAAAVAPIMPDIGSHIFATWTRGKYELYLIGGVGACRLCEFGALPVTLSEHRSTVLGAEDDLTRNITESPAPPDTEVAPPDARQVPTPPDAELSAADASRAVGATEGSPGIRVADLGAASVRRVSTFGA